MVPVSISVHILSTLTISPNVLGDAATETLTELIRKKTHEDPVHPFRKGRVRRDRHRVRPHLGTDRSGDYHCSHDRRHKPQDNVQYRRDEAVRYLRQGRLRM